MINPTLISPSVNKITADFTFPICVTGLVCTYCQNTNYCADLQRPYRWYESMVRSKNLLNQRAAVFYTNSVQLQSRAIYH